MNIPAVVKLLILVVAVFLIQLIFFSDIFAEKLISLVGAFSTKTLGKPDSLNFVGSIAITGMATTTILFIYFLVVNL